MAQVNFTGKERVGRITIVLAAIDTGNTTLEGVSKAGESVKKSLSA